MTSKDDKLVASQELVAFINKYTILLEQQLDNIRKTMSTTVSKVMTDIEALSKAADLTKSSAPKNIKDMVAGGSLSNKFSGELSDILMSMMGALSADDVIAQRLAHVVSGIQTFNVGMSYVLMDFDNRFNTAAVNRLTDDILKTTYRYYTTEEERDIFKTMFGKCAG